MIELSHDEQGYLVTHRADGNEVLGAVRFGNTADALEFATLWNEWLGPSAHDTAGNRAAGNPERAFR